MKNIISQSLGLDLLNINVYAKVYQNIPLSLRDRAIFTLGERGGSVVECRTPEREVGGSRPTAAVLCP